MQLHQINLTYDLREDRILFRATFGAQDEARQETRAWLTRRLVRNLWPGLVQALESQITLDMPQAAHARTDLVGMAHQESIEKFSSGGNFNRAYEEVETAPDAPAKNAAFLIHTARFTLKSKQPVRINFLPENGKGFEIAFGQPLLHGFCKLLQDASAKAQWGLDLKMPGAATVAPASRLLN